MTDVGEIIKALNDFGRFQAWLVVLLSLSGPFVGFHMFSQLFMVLEELHHCNTSWFDTIGLNLTQEEKLNFTLPKKPDGTFEECFMFTPVEEQSLAAIERYGLNSTEKCQEGWVYPSKREPSLVTQFDLVCDRKDLIDISQSIFMVGLLVGAPVSGMLSDRYGRRPLTLLSLLIVGVFGVATAFAPNFYVYSTLRFLVGISISGCSISISAIGTEWVGVNYRPHTFIFGHLGFAIGQMVLGGLAYGLRDWRVLQIVGSAPVLALFFYIWVLPESPRWLVTKGKVKEAKRLLQKAAAVNKRTIPPYLLDQMNPEKKAKSSSILDLFRKPQLMKVTLVMSSVWFVNSLAYYGLSLNVGRFGVNIYLTQVIFGAVEIPARGICLFLMQWIGRKKCQAYCLFLGGAVCLLITVIPKNLPVVVTVLAVIGKFTIAGSFSTSYVYTAELFPTAVRQTGNGVCQMIARVAGILSPLVGFLEQFHTSIPVVIFGSAAMAGGILSFLLPETCGRELLDFVDEVGGETRTSKTVGRRLENGHVKPTEENDQGEQTTVTRL